MLKARKNLKIVSLISWFLVAFLNYEHNDSEESDEVCMKYQHFRMTTTITEEEAEGWELGLEGCPEEIEETEVEEEDLEEIQEAQKGMEEDLEVAKQTLVTQKIQDQHITHSMLFSNCSTPHSHYSNSDVQSMGGPSRTNDGLFTNDVLEESYKKLKVEKLEMEAEMELREKHFKELESQKGALKNEFNQIMNQNKALLKDKEDFAEKLRELEAENVRLRNQLKEEKGKATQVFSKFHRFFIKFSGFISILLGGDFQKFMYFL